MLFEPPCDCEICLRQYRSKRLQESIPWYYFKHADNPAHLALSSVKSIKEDREFLYRTITASGSAILKRWRAGEGKRRQYLVKVQPEIYPYSQPLIDIACRVQKMDQIPKLRVAYLLPYVNIEDLSKDSANFIRLLHYRTTFPPEDWVHYDNAQLQPGWDFGGPREISAEGCIIMQGEQYGTGKEFDRSAVHHGYAYGAVRGLLILEAQQILMSTLRKMVVTILEDAHAASKTSVTAAAFPIYDLTSCSKWVRFVEAQPHRDKAWLSVASVYTQQPYSAPTYFDIDKMIEIAGEKALEAEDELWLLQTDLDYFNDKLQRNEREWLDSIPRMDEVKIFSPKNKMDNIGYIMTVTVAIQARDWQWLLEECQAVKIIMGKPEARTRMGEPFLVEYERALCGLQYLLREVQTLNLHALEKLFLKSPSFSSIVEVKALGKDDRNSWALDFGFKEDYSQLYRKDRTGWCLYNLTKDTGDYFTFESSVVLQHLEKFLESCPRQETERIDQEMYKCISDRAAVERMLSILELHRPNFASHAQIFFFQPRQAWRVHSRLFAKPSRLTCTSLGMSSALEPARLRMPTGYRNEQWLDRRDQAQQALNDLWGKARSVYQTIMEASNVPHVLIKPQLEMMTQGDSPENKTRLDIERQHILGRLQAARQRVIDNDVTPPRDTANFFFAQRDQLPHEIQEPVKEKIKTRPDAPSPPASLHAKYAALFGKLAIGDEISETEKPPPVLYTFKQNSVSLLVISLMFPDRSKGIEQGAKLVEWLDFVFTMKTLGFGVEHGGGSHFTFKGAIRLPSDPLTLQKRSITAHMPHPSTEMSPILLQSLGKRCNRRFGWQRANFAAGESGVGEGT